MLAKVVSIRKLDDKSMKLIYLLRLAMFPYKVQIVTDLKSVKAEHAAACLICWSPVSLL